MLDLLDRSGTNDNVRLVLQNWLNQFWDIVRTVLIVGIGVNDDICPGRDACSQSGYETAGKTLVTAKADDVIDAMPFGDGNCVISATIIDDEPFNFIYARKGFW